MFRHDDETVHVPTALPPQGTTLEQDCPAPPLPELPPVPDGMVPLEPHAPKTIPKKAIASVAADPMTPLRM
jgi:hypothetical protein